MFYYLAQILRPHLGAFNVFTYNTVRAGGAIFTAFALSILFGPMIIRWLRALKIGQYIRKEHVGDLHALHKGKAGTPTMGGSMIVLTCLATLLLWSRPTRLLVVAVAVFVALGAVGFLDDYIKLRRKHNHGLSAQAKFTGQILVGLALGVYLYLSPVTLARPELTYDDVRDWGCLVQRLDDEALRRPLGAAWPGLSDVPRGAVPNERMKTRILNGLNRLISEGRVHASEGDTSHAGLSPEARRLLEAGAYARGGPAAAELNRLLLADMFPDAFHRPTEGLHTKLEIPGLKQVFIPLGLFYILFVVLVIVASSNAVNLTDGLDGLAIGASTISIFAYTGIAYVVSRADWSSYLFLIYVPEASELTVFGAAMLGGGLGFLWFNSHPAEVFMGDTGSLALGGALGTMAILTKQELLLLLVGGLFVVEAASVIIQVVSFKLRGKRVFKMAPIHHHFELMGWSESKVVIRFWIIAVLFALLSLAALKLR